jgi:hypothetical protein
VASQRPDGWHAACRNDASGKPYDLWAVLLVDKVLVQYHEATGDAATLDAVVRRLRELNRAWILRKVLFALSPVEALEPLLERLSRRRRTRNSWKACRRRANVGGPDSRERAGLDRYLPYLAVDSRAAAARSRGTLARA